MSVQRKDRGGQTQLDEHLLFEIELQMSHVEMICEMDSGFDSESLPGTSFESECFFKSRPRANSDCSDSIVESSASVEDWGPDYSCASSVYGDSGFNSDNEDRDDIAENMFKEDRSFDDDECDSNIEREHLEIGENFQNSEYEIDSLGYSENAISNTRVPRLRELSSDLNKKFEVSSKLHPDLVVLNAEDKNCKGSKNSTPAKKTVTRNKIKRDNSANTSAISRTPATLRTIRHGRSRTQDVNNNNGGPRGLRSYLGKASFRIQDCFQDKGLLALVACIIYTLALVVVISVLHTVAQYFKYCEFYVCCVTCFTKCQ